MARDYLKSKGLKLNTWLSAIKNGKWPDVLALFILCIATETHCFVHLCNGIWSTLQEDPQSHLEYFQCFNVHLAYISSGIYVQLIPHTEMVNFQICGLLDLIEMDIETKPVTIGSLTSDENETLNKLLKTGLSLPSKSTSQVSATITQAVLELPNKLASHASAIITKAEYEKQQLQNEQQNHDLDATKITTATNVKAQEVT